MGKHKKLRKGNAEPMALFAEKTQFKRLKVKNLTHARPGSIPASVPEAPTSPTDPNDISNASTKLIRQRINWTWPKNVVDLPSKPIYDITGREVKKGDLLIRIANWNDKPKLLLTYVVDVKYGHAAIFNIGGKIVAYTNVVKRGIIVTDSPSICEVFQKYPIEFHFGKKVKEYVPRPKKSKKDLAKRGKAAYKVPANTERKRQEFLKKKGV